MQPDTADRRGKQRQRSGSMFDLEIPARFTTSLATRNIRSIILESVILASERATSIRRSIES